MTRITLRFDGRCPRRLILAVVLTFISFAQLSTGAEQARPLDLAAAMQEIDRVIAESTRTSSTYKIFGQLRTTDLGSRVTSWYRPGRFLIDDFAKHLHTLFFYAVCREHPAAFEALARIDRLIRGGLLSANQHLYLADRARRLKPSIRFHAPRRTASAPPDNDLNSINRRQRLVAALQSGQLHTARWLVPGFTLLCRPK